MDLLITVVGLAAVIGVLYLLSNFVSIVVYIIITLFIALILRIPIAFSLLFSAVSTIVLYGQLPANFLIQGMYTAGESKILLAIPFFILAGEAMLYGGMSERLIRFVKALFGHVPGALGIVTVVACGFFAALSGSGPATVAAIGSICIPAMVNEKYDRGFACLLTAAGGCLGPIIPPSIFFVIYASIVSVSVTDMFIGGVLPGIIMMVALVGYVLITCRKHGFGARREKRASGKEVLRSFLDAIWALMVPIIILGGIYGGVFSPTEAAIVASDYALIVGIFVYKKIRTPKDFLNICTRAGLTAGTVLLLVGCASTFARILTVERVPAMISEAVLGISDNKIVILLLINLILLIVGMFLDGMTAMLIFVPLFVAIVKPLGVDLVQFGIMVTVNLVIGTLTPPMGTHLFIAARIGETPLQRMFRWLPGTLAVLIISLLIITYIPVLVTGPIALLGG